MGFICIIDDKVFQDFATWFDHCNGHTGAYAPQPCKEKPSVGKKSKKINESVADILADHAVPEPEPAEDHVDPKLVHEGQGEEPVADSRGISDLTVDQLHNAMVNLCEPVDFGNLDSYKTKDKASSFLLKCIGLKKFTLEDVLANTGNKPAGRVKRAATTAAPIRKIPGVVRTSLNPALKMHILVVPNPRTPGSKRHERYESYKEGMTVEEWIKLGVGTPQELKWDADHDGILELK